MNDDDPTEVVDDNKARVLMTLRQVAAMLGVQPKKIHRWREDYGLPYCTVLYSNRRNYPRGAVKRWAKEHGKRVYPIIDPKKEDVTKLSLWRVFNKLDHDEPVTDPYVPSPARCRHCGKRLLVHINGGHWKCPSGCSLRKQPKDVVRQSK